MKNKLLIACVVIVLGILAFGTISASAATEGIYTYSVSGGEATITDCSYSARGDITIPSTLGGYPVTSIGYYAFSACTSLKSVTIPDSVRSIGDYAFCNCTSLKSVTIGNGVTSIGDRAFSGCESLTSVTIGNSVTSIGSSAFYNCKSLTSVNITDIAAWCNISFSDGSNPLYYAKKLYLNGELVTDLVIPEGVTSIGDYAFHYCASLKSVTIPDSVTSIGYRAFEYCTSLTSVTIGNSVTNIGNYAFYNCTSLKSVTIPDSVTSIGWDAFSNCTSLTSITIPDSVTRIGYRAFYYCTSLTSVTIGNGVISIGESAFYNCTSLTSVNITDIAAWCNISFSDGSNPLYYAKKLYLNGELVADLVIPEGVTSIGEWAFYNCRSLTSVTIPDSVTSIGDDAFYNCTSLESVTIPDSVKSIGSSAFENCTSLTRVNITDITAWCNISFGSGSSNPLCYANYLYLNGELVADLVIPEGVTTIGNYAFRECTSLTSVTIPDSVTSIGNYAFSDCTGLKSVTLGDSVTSIGNCAFSDCTSLTIVTIPDSVTSIGYSVFEYCTSLESVTIGSSVTSIGNYAFYNCTSLTIVTIPDSVTSIGNYAFSDCTSLESINVDENNKYFSSDERGVLFNKDKTTLVQYPIGKSTTSYSIPDSVTSIGDRAFYECTSLTSVTIPDSVTSIGKYAFYNCTKLKTVYYSGTADMWNKISIGSNNSSLTSANRIYVVNIKIVCETGEEISFFHISGKAIDDSYITKKQYYTPVFYKDENRTEKISVDTPISESITLYLGYEPILYTHIFLDDDGNVLKTESVPFGTVIVPPEAPTKEATDEYTYTFAGWKDFTSGMTQTDVELVFVAEYDATLNILEKFKLSCDCKVEIGSTFDLTASFATNTPAQYIYLTLAIPDGLEINKITPIDFIEISLEGKKSEGGYTYFTYLGVFDYNGTDIPKNEKIVPFNIELEASTDVVEYLILVTEASLINNEGSFIPFENAQGVTITVKPKLAESITISGSSSIDKPTSFTATVYPDYTSNKEVLWSVSDETVAEINENGLLTPIKNGTVIVSATAADGSGCVASKSVEIIKYAEITSLSSDVGVWDKAFSPDVYEYTIAVFGDVSSITLTPTFNGGVLRPNGTGLWISGTKKSFALGEDTTTITLVRQNVTDNTNSTYTVNVVKAKSEFVGAQIRTEDPQGLRFVFSIPRAVYDAIEHPESPDDIGLGFGSVVMPKKYLGDNELTKETSVTLNGRVYKSKIAPAVNLFEITDDEVKFTACLIEIPEKNYVEEYVAVPYMTYMENGEEITVYGEKTEGITVFAIAEMAYADSSTSNNVKQFLLENVLNVIKPDVYPKVFNDYRIVLSYKIIADEDGKEKKLYNVLDVTNATVASDVELAKGVVAPAAGTIVLMNEDGKIAGAANVKNAYVEEYMFTATFTGDYDEENKFLNIGDGNTYLITDNTSILYFTSTSVYEMAEDDIFTVEDNDYEGLENLTSFKLYIVADDTADDTIKVVKSIIVTR